MTSSLHSLRSHYSSSLKRFIASSKAFEVLATVPPPSPPPPHPHPPPAPQVLYVLDSSFNPPTIAHLDIASSVLVENLDLPSRLLLLLATQNADKPSRPASFEDRLVMMELFARDLLSHLKSTPTTTTGTPTDQVNLPQIDIGVTKKPYFVDKAVEIDSAGVYSQSLEQVHLIGYDTLIRIFNTKYYPPEHTLKPLEPFLAHHRLRVTVRPDDEWGDHEEQQAFLHTLAQGGREHEGAKKEWAQRIQFVQGKKPGEQAVSSTKAREAVRTKNNQNLEWLVPQSVRDYILSQHPYPDD